MTLRGGGAEGLGCGANILFKAHLDFGGCVACETCPGWIHSHHIPIAEADFILPIFVCLEISNS